jgi:hypothetical protein
MRGERSERGVRSDNFLCGEERHVVFCCLYLKLVVV